LTSVALDGVLEEALQAAAEPEPAAEEPAEEVVDSVDAEAAPVVEVAAEETEEEAEVEEESVVETLVGFTKRKSSLFGIRQAPAANSEESAEAVQWGAWNEPVPEYLASKMTISAGDYSVDLTPTEMGNLTGSYNYSSVVDYQGHGSAGPLTNVQASFDVDFNSGEISDGLQSVDVADRQNWLLGFDGLIEQGIVGLNSLGGVMTEFSPTAELINPIEGDLSGAFTGAEAEAFVGGFELLDSQNALNTVEGIYTIER